MNHLFGKFSPLFNLLRLYAPDDGDGGGGNGGSADTSDDDTQDEDGDKEDSTFTQAQVDKFNAKTRREAEEKTKAKLLETLGVESIDDAKTILVNYLL